MARRWVWNGTDRPYSATVQCHRHAEVGQVRVWRWGAAAAVWLLAVAVVAGVAWFAIDSAGREVLGADGAVSLVAVQPSPTALRAARPGAPAQVVPPTRAPSVPGPRSGRTSTYSTAAGDVVVRCAGDDVTGWAMRAADGWRAEAAPKAGGRLEVLFVARDGQLAGVEAACQNGQASFTPARQSSRG
jgi:hypothetical protein